MAEVEKEEVGMVEEQTVEAGLEVVKMV